MRCAGESTSGRDATRWVTRRVSRRTVPAPLPVVSRARWVTPVVRVVVRALAAPSATAQPSAAERRTLMMASDFPPGSLPAQRNAVVRVPAAAMTIWRRKAVGGAASARAIHGSLTTLDQPAPDRRDRSQHHGRAQEELV